MSVFLTTYQRNRIASLLLAIILGGCAGSSNRVVSHTLDNRWKFVQGDDINYAKPLFDDASWIVISSKTAFEFQGFPLVDGYVWYRKRFTMHEDLERAVWKTGGMRIHLGTIDDVDQLYVNGMLVNGSGSFPPNYVSAFHAERTYVIPAACLVRGRENVLAVRVYDGNNIGGIVADSIVIRNLSHEEMAIFSSGQKQK